MIKKLFKIFILLLVTFNLIGCGNKKSENQTEEPLTEETKQNDIVMQISVDNLKLRDAPNLESNTITMLPINSQVTFRGEMSEKKTIVPINSIDLEDFWYNVETIDGKQGWLHGCCIFDTSVKNIAGNYPEGSQRLLREEELAEVDFDILSIMRNEIYARNGYKFSKGGNMELYFKEQDWYKSKSEVKEVQLTSIEKYNVALIQKEESVIELQAEYESDQQEYGDNIQSDEDSFPNSNLKNGDKFQIEFDGSYYTIDHTKWKNFKKNNKSEFENNIVEAYNMRVALVNQNPQQLNLIANGVLNGINSEIAGGGMTMSTLSKIQAFNILTKGDLQFE